MRIPHQERVSNRGQDESIAYKPTIFEQIDLLGFVLLAGFAIQLLLALEWGGGRFPWNSSVIIGMLCGSVATLVLFCYVQHRKGDRALIPLRIAGQRVVFCGCIVFGILMTCSFQRTFYMPMYFQSVMNATAMMSGVYMLPNVISQVAATLVSGYMGESSPSRDIRSKHWDTDIDIRTVGKFGYYLPWSVTSIVAVAVSSGLLSTLRVDAPTGEWIGYQILHGFGCGVGAQMVSILGLLRVTARLSTSRRAILTDLVTCFSPSSPFKARYRLQTSLLLSHCLCSLRTYFPPSGSQLTI